LKLSIAGSSGNDNKPAIIAEQIAGVKVSKPILIVPPPTNIEEDSSMVIQKTVKIPVAPSLSFVDQPNTVSHSADSKLASFQNSIKQFPPVVSPSQLQGSIVVKEEQQNSPIVPVSESSTIQLREPRDSFPVLATSNVVEKKKFEIQLRVSSERHSRTISSLSWSHDSNKIVSGSWDTTIKIWNGKSLELLKTLNGHSDTVWSVSWNHDGRLIASGSGDKTIKIWDSSGYKLQTLRGHSDWVQSVAWNHNSSKIVSGSNDETIKVWHWTKSTFYLWNGRMTWKILKTLKCHSRVFSVSWNHDGSRILSGSWDHQIKIWDSSTGIVLKILSDQSYWVRSVCWSPDDSKIVSGSMNKTGSVRIWNAITGDVMKTLEGHSNWISCVAWSPDDRTIASCSYEEKIIIWDALTGQEMNTIQPVGEVKSVSWNRDGSELVCADGGEIKVLSFRN
jgi:WD40 repeat protein